MRVASSLKTLEIQTDSCVLLSGIDFAFANCSSFSWFSDSAQTILEKEEDTMKRYKRVICALLAGVLLCGALSLAAPQEGGSPETQAEIPQLLLNPEEAVEYGMKVNDRVQLRAPDSTETTEEPDNPAEPGSGSSEQPEADEILWRSDNPDVVSVTEDGLVTALAQTETPVEVAGRRENGEVLVCRITVSGYAVTGLTLKPERSTMQVGETQTISADIEPEQAADAALTWRSADEDILTVTQDGTVTAVGEGTTDLFAEAENGLSAKCTITVSGWLLTGFSLEPSAVQLKVGETKQLAAKPQPEGAALGTLRWTSGSPSVASVAQDGTVTAKAAGTAVITAANADGKTAASTVTVTGTGTGEDKVTAITLNRKTLTLTVGGAETLKATITPKQLQNTPITWKSSNAAVARVDKNGKVTALKAGSAVVTASAGGVSAQCTVTVKKKTVSGGIPSGGTTTPTVSGNPGSISVPTGVTGGAGILYLPGTLIPADSVRQYTMPQYIPDTVFLTIDSDMSSNIVSILSVLESAGVRATFFVPVENLYASDDLLRHIAGDGHSIGLLLTRTQAEANPVELLNSANETLSVITGTPTRLVRIAGGSAGNLNSAAAQAIRAGGYRLWDWSTAPRSYEAAVSAINRTGSVTVRFDSSANTASVLQQLMPYMKYCGIPARGIGAGDTPICQTP